MSEENRIPTVLVPLAQGCEELEAITIVDLLRRAGISVVTAGLDDRPVTASRGTTLIPDTTLDKVEIDALDMIALPGGLPGADHLNSDARIHSTLKLLSEKSRLVAAICAAPKVLLTAGLLDGKRATCYPGSLDRLDCSNINLTGNAVVVDGNVITSRGPGTAMDFALTLIEVLGGKAKRDEVEAGLVR